MIPKPAPVQTEHYADKLDMLERTVLDLGSEVYSLRSAITKSKQAQEQVLSIFKGLKQLLDDKGLITLEDFDAAVELGGAIERFHTTYEQVGVDLSDKEKKSGH